MLPSAGVLAGGPYDGTYSGQIQPGGCASQVVGLGGWSGNLDSSGKVTLKALNVRNPREFSITVSGDTF